MATDLHEWCAELHLIGKAKPDAANRLKVEEALASKWEGVRLAAAKTLGLWGDEESLNTLRALLVEFASRPSHGTATWTIARLLEPHLKSDEFDWVCDLFLNGSHRDSCGGLEDLFEKFPPESVLQRMEAEMKERKLKGSDHALAHALRGVIYRARWRIDNQTKSPAPHKGRPSRRS
jgi:hypothetical protein